MDHHQGVLLVLAKLLIKIIKYVLISYKIQKLKFLCVRQCGSISLLCVWRVRCAPSTRITRMCCRTAATDVISCDNILIYM